MMRWPLIFSSATALAAGLALAAAPTPELAAAAREGWGTVKGQVVFTGAAVPAPQPLKVDKDRDHCLSKGELKAVTWAVNESNKGVANVVVFLRPEPGQKLPVHDSLKTPHAKDVVLDQPCCAFEPRVLAMRADQTLLAKNPAPIAHNVVIQGFKNSQNVQLAPGSQKPFELFSENNVIGISCGAHPWMKGHLWVFDHPYFAVTDQDGRFEIKLAPAGTQTLVLWHEEIGYVGGKKGRTVQIAPGGATDVGALEIKPQ
jgi:hypothetical protein